MPVNSLSQKTLTYWRDTLIAASFRDIKISANSDKLSHDEIISGKISEALAIKLFKDEENERHTDKKEHFKKENKEDEIIILDVLLAYRPFRPKQRGRNQDTEFSSLVYIPAKLARDGTLSAYPTVPWIPRCFLEPTEEDVVVGSFSDFDEFLTKNPLSETAEWKEVIEFTKDMFLEVVGEDIDKFEPDGHSPISTGYILRDKEDAGPAKNIVKLYEYLLDMDKIIPPLLESLIEGKASEIATEFDFSNKPVTENQIINLSEEPVVQKNIPNQKQLLPSKIAEDMKIHVGQMRSDYGLARSQRQALIHSIKTAPGQMLAINGPPGTGKTTLLQSVIASLWVNAVLKETNADPPVILGCSMNNQAVFNILDSFADDTKSNETLKQRWLPDIKGYGLSFPAETMLKKEGFTKKYLYAQISFNREQSWPGLPTQIENKEYLEKAKAYYTERATAFFPDLTATVPVLPKLREALLEEQKILNEWLNKIAVFEQFLIDNGFDPFNQTIDEIERKVTESLQKKEASLLGAEQELKNARARLEREVKWQKFAWEKSAPKNFIDKLFSFLPHKKKARYAQMAKLYAQESKAKSVLKPADLLSHFINIEKVRRDKVEIAEREYAKLDSEHGLQKIFHATISKWFEEARAKISRWLEETRKSDPDFPDFHLIRIADMHMLLDQQHRSRMFHLAARYWEGRWLKEMDKAFEKNEKLGSQSEDDVKRRFRRWAMLTPCFISTMHMASRIFTFYKGVEHPLLNFIDMLIVDEAGQISPEIGGAIFGLPKRAVVVGDIYQIEPIWSAARTVDRANLKHHNLDPDEMEKRGASCSSGSIMKLAGSATKWTLPDAGNEPGLFLSEHRRCKRDIIAYCNNLVYGGRLQPMRKDNEPNGISPPMGYCHVTYPAKRNRTSYQNEGEASAILKWMENNREKLENYYKKPIHEIVALITPYRAQANLLQRKLRDQKIKTGHGGLTVGTVHALQGAERPVVILSLTVNYEEGQRLFFDGSVNMLNVAVSRAKDSFMVFGDMRLLDPRGSKPSSILARHLFANEDDEVGTGDVTYGLATAPEVPVEISRISTLTKHRETLRRAIDKASQQLLIVSPFMTINAINADQLLEPFEAAIKRGVKIRIVTSEDLNMNYDRKGNFKPNFLEAEEALKKAGCEVKRARRVHNKMIAIDDDWLVEGSFNWLSSVRNEESSFQYREVSLIHTGPHVADYIQKEKELYGLK